MTKQPLSLSFFAFLVSACARIVLPIDPDAMVADGGIEVPPATNGHAWVAVFRSSLHIIGSGTHLPSDVWGGYASFYPSSGSYRETTAGPCRIAISTTRLPGVSAGELAFVVNGSSHGAIFDPMYGQYGLVPVEEIIHPGDSVDLRGSGAVAPAFRASLVAPPDIEVVSPRPNSAGGLTIDTNQDLAISWTGSPPWVLVALTYTGGNTLTCRFDGSQSPAVIPAATLQAVPGRGVAAMQIAGAAYAVQGIDGWRVETWFLTVALST